MNGQLGEGGMTWKKGGGCGNGGGIGIHIAGKQNE
jgi:hypothetical protein